MKAPPNLGPRVRDLLKKLGVGHESLEHIARGSVTADVISGDFNDNESDLLLFDESGAHKFIARLTPRQADELLNAWDYERRPSRPSDDASVFPPATHEEWTGVAPDTDWETLITAYRAACCTMRGAFARTITEPWLFLCRHTLELQLKAIVMLGQQSLSLTPDLPGHHDLDRLWTAAYPFACLRHNNDTDRADKAKAVVLAYHSADRGSYAFRYPVNKNNEVIRHSPILQVFQPAKHAEAVEGAFNYLGDVIRKLRFRLMFKRVGEVAAASVARGKTRKRSSRSSRPS